MQSLLCPRGLGRHPAVLPCMTYSPGRGPEARSPGSPALKLPQASCPGHPGTRQPPGSLEVAPPYAPPTSAWTQGVP